MRRGTSRTFGWWSAGIRSGAILGLLGAVGCAASGPSSARTGHETASCGDAAASDLRSLYPGFFAAVDDPAWRGELDLAPLRGDLERSPADARNYAALRALAIGYCALNARAEAARGEEGYLGHSFDTARLVAVPWRAYGLVAESSLRDAILDFFARAGSAGGTHSAATASRLAPIVDSLARHESDPARLERIRSLAAALRAAAPERR